MKYLAKLLLLLLSGTSFSSHGTVFLNNDLGSPVNGGSSSSSTLAASLDVEDKENSILRVQSFTDEYLLATIDEALFAAPKLPSETSGNPTSNWDDGNKRRLCIKFSKDHFLSHSLGKDVSRARVSRADDTMLVSCEGDEEIRGEGGAKLPLPELDPIILAVTYPIGYPQDINIEPKLDGSVTGPSAPLGGTKGFVIGFNNGLNHRIDVYFHLICKIAIKGDLLPSECLSSIAGAAAAPSTSLIMLASGFDRKSYDPKYRTAVMAFVPMKIVTTLAVNSTMYAAKVGLRFYGR